MKTLAKCHVCNRCVIGEKTFKIYLSGPVSYRDFRETGPRSTGSFTCEHLKQRNLLTMNEKHFGIRVFKFAVFKKKFAVFSKRNRIAAVIVLVGRNPVNARSAPLRNKA